VAAIDPMHNYSFTQRGSYTPLMDRVWSAFAAARAAEGDDQPK
jgi:hypothetical protein